MIPCNQKTVDTKHCSLCILDKEQANTLSGRTIIFLDMDGVLFPTEISRDLRERISQTVKALFDQEYSEQKPYEWRQACSYHLLPYAVTNLMGLIQKIEAQGREVGIVISSAWREDGTTEQVCHEMFKAQPFSRYIIGRTEHKGDCRAQQIQAWVQHHGIRNFVIFDDGYKAELTDTFSKQFVHTPGTLTENRAEQAFCSLQGLHVELLLIQMKIADEDPDSKFPLIQQAITYVNEGKEGDYWGVVNEAFHPKAELRAVGGVLSYVTATIELAYLLIKKGCTSPHNYDQLVLQENSASFDIRNPLRALLDTIVQTEYTTNGSGIVQRALERQNMEGLLWALRVLRTRAALGDTLDYTQAIKQAALDGRPQVLQALKELLPLLNCDLVDWHSCIPELEHGAVSSNVLCQILEWIPKDASIPYTIAALLDEIDRDPADHLIDALRQKVARLPAQVKGQVVAQVVETATCWAKSADRKNPNKFKVFSCISPEMLSHEEREKVRTLLLQLINILLENRDRANYFDLAIELFIPLLFALDPKACQETLDNLLTKKASGIQDIVKFLLIYKAFNKERFDSLDSNALFKEYRASFRLFFEKNKEAEQLFRDSPLSLERFNNYLLDPSAHWHTHWHTMIVIADDEAEANGPFHRAALTWTMNEYNPFKYNTRRPCRLLYADNREIARAAVARLQAVCDSLTDQTEPERFTYAMNDILTISPTEDFTEEIKHRMLLSLFQRAKAIAPDDLPQLIETGKKVLGDAFSKITF